MADQNAYQTLDRRLRSFRTQFKLFHFAEKTLLFLTILFVVISTLPALYFIGQNDSIFRWLISIAVIVALLVFGYRFVMKPLFSLLVDRENPSIEKAALQIGDANPEIKDKLSNAYQLIRQLPEMEGESQSLAWAAFDSINRSTAHINFNATIDKSNARRQFGWFCGALILFVAAYLLYPSHVLQAVALLLNPAKQTESAAVQFSVQPGSTEVVRGESLEVSAMVQNAVVPAAQIEARYQGGDFLEAYNMSRSGQSRFDYRFENVTEPFSYAVRMGKNRSQWFDVSVLILPDIRELQLTLHYPRYTKMSPLRLDPNVGNITALAGTEVVMTVMPNKSISAAAVIFSSGDTLALQKNSELFEAKFRIDEDDSYFIALRDNKDLINKNPIVYQVSTTPDQNPVVEITFPGKDLDLDETMEMPIAIEGEDDFGFSKLQLAYETIPGGPETEAVKGTINIQYQASDGKLQARTIWDLVPLQLLPDDAVEYQAVLYDNDTVNGPKAAVSQKFRLRYPSVQEIFNQTARQQEDAVESFEEMVKKTREVKENVDEMIQNMLRQQEMDWEDKQQLKQNLDSQKDVFDKMQEAQSKLDEMVDQLERNDLLSMETIEKYQELQQLLDEIASPELKEMLEKLQSAVENVDPKQIRKALEDLQASQEAFLKSMEKTINLLKQLQAEQRLDEAMKAVQEMQERQQQINQDAKQAPDSSSLSNLAQKELQQQERLSDVQNALKDLQSRMDELPQMRMPEDRIQKAQEMSQEQGKVQSEMRRMLQQLRRGEQQQAQQSGEQVSQSLEEMYNELSQAQRQMQMQQKSQVRQALQRGSRDLLQLSQEQEQLRQESARHSQATMDQRKMADEQQNLLSGMQRVVNQLFETSQNSFFVPPKIAAELGKAMQGMQGAIRELENQQGRNAANRQGQAMQGLNGAADQLRQAMKALNQSGGKGGSGMEQMMQRMLGIAGEQEGLNQQTQGMGNQGQLSMQQQASLARLAAQQEALRKSLQQLAEEFGNSNGGEVLGNLDKIQQDMGEVVQDLARQNVRRETIERQRRILSRLLDATRSAQQRDVSKKRRAETGKQYTAIDPGYLPSDLGEAQTKIQQDLLKAMRENYSKDYKVLIQKYFEALSKQLRNEGEK